MKKNGYADLRVSVEPKIYGALPPNNPPCTPAEDKPTSLGFKDPRIVEPPPWETVRPSKFTRLKNWVHLHLYRPWQ